MRTMNHNRTAFLALIGLFFSITVFTYAEVQEVAPGVFFRVSDAGCNNGWIVFKDSVTVIDGNFPSTAKAVLEEIQKTTPKPIRFVFDTHTHGDHILGNGIFTRVGATIVASRGFLKVNPDTLRQEFDQYRANHPNDPELEWAPPTLFFDERLVVEDSEHRAELLSYGHGHNPGDAVLYLPKEKILFTGDLCVNGVFNYLADANLEAWIHILETLQGLDVETICPGHGKIAGKELLQIQKEYLIQLRDQVQKGIDTGKSQEEIAQSIDIPDYQKWTGSLPPEHNIRDMYKILTGQLPSWDLLELGLQEGNSPTKDTPGWTAPKKMLLQGANEKELDTLKRIAPEMEFVLVRSQEEILEQIGEADAIAGSIDPEILAAAKRLRWVHSITAGVEDILFPELISSEVVLTNGQGCFGSAIADYVIQYALMLSKGQNQRYANQLQAGWDRTSRHPLQDMEGKTLLILGLGGIGSQVAQRAKGFGMNILAVDPQSMEKPYFVQQIAPPDRLHDLLTKADYVVSTVPLTKSTLRYFDKTCFERMKPSAYFINVGRGKTVNQDDLIQALQQKTIAGAALDVTDPEPLPPDNPLWKMENVIITPHVSGHSSESWQRANMIRRENIRRFAQGLPLLNVVNKQAGY